jgi:DNA-binding MarR family transcriptional regulator
MNVDEQKFELDNELNFLRELWALNHSLETASKRMETLLGITARQRVIIRILGRYPGITAGQLAEVLRVDPGTLSAAISRLETRCLVERRRDTRDQRRVTIMLTAKGRQLDVPSPHTVEDAVRKALLDTSALDRKVISKFFRKLIDSLERSVTT